MDEVDGLPFRLFRAAIVQIAEAKRLSRSRTPGRRSREGDLAAAAIILIQASLESWIKSLVGEIPKHTAKKNWLELWRDGPLQEPSDDAKQMSPLRPPDEAYQYLKIMNDARNYFVHGDHQARRRVLRHFRDARAFSYSLSSWLPAQWMLEDANRLFTHAESVTGLPAPTLDNVRRLNPDLFGG